MDKDFMQYVYRRCERAVLKDEEYKRLQGECIKISGKENFKEYEELSCQMETRAEELCYLQGFNDAIRVLFNTK